MHRAVASSGYATNQAEFLASILQLNASQNVSDAQFNLFSLILSVVWRLPAGFENCRRRTERNSEINFVRRALNVESYAS